MNLRKALLGVWLLAHFSATAFAGDKPEWREWPTGERLRVSGGIFFPNLDTTVTASDSADNIGTEINFERDFGLSDSESTTLLYANWRVFKKHSLSLDYFSLNRSGSGSTDVTINFNGQDFAANLPIESYFDIDAIELVYKYSLFFTPKNDFSLGIGLAAQDLNFGIQGAQEGNESQIISETVETTAPLPTIKIGYTHAFNDKWLLSLNVGYLAVSLDLGDDEKLDGSVWNASAGLRWKALRNLEVMASYAFFQVDIDYEKPDLIGNIDYKYNGPLIGIGWYF